MTSHDIITRMVSGSLSFCANSCTSENIEKEGSGRMVTVALIIRRSVTRSMRRPRDTCPMEKLVNDTLGAGHCIREGFVGSTSQGWGVEEWGEGGMEARARGKYIHVYCMQKR